VGLKQLEHGTTVYLHLVLRLRMYGAYSKPLEYGAWAQGQFHLFYTLNSCMLRNISGSLVLIEVIVYCLQGCLKLQCVMPGWLG
jgi:hypothetical protein